MIFNKSFTLSKVLCIYELIQNIKTLNKICVYNDFRISIYLAKKT